MPRRILTPSGHGDETIAIAHDLIPPEFELIQAPHGRPEFWDILKDVEFYIGAGQYKHGPEFYAQAPKLKLVQTLSAGYNTYDLDAARAAGVPICNNGGANATAVAEHAIMLMLAVSRNLISVHDGVVSGRWRGNDFNSTKLYELEDKVLGIVGLGNIGTKVARRAKAFDMRVQYYDINRLTTAQEDSLGIRFALFPEILKTSDYVSLHCPLMPETKHIMNAKTFAMMKPGSYIVNTGRGPLIDEAALAAALDKGQLAGAALDVVEKEPPTDSPILGRDNVIITPHTAFYSEEALLDLQAKAAEEVVRVLSGQAPKNPVNPEALKAAG